MATDQEIRDAGFKYIPQQKYLQNPFELPTTPEEEPVINQGIVNTNAFNYGGGGNDFNVYNPDPNSIINRNYQPNYDYRKSVDYNPELSDLQNQKIMQGMPNFKGYDYYNKPELTGAQKFLQFAGSFVPGAGAAGLISPYLPVNRRRIFENELGGKGIMVNNIGQIVRGQGDYNTAENVMAGYNANLITQETIDKRKGTIEKTFANKYGLTKSEIDSIKAGDITKDIIDKTKGSKLVDRYGALDEFGNTLNLTTDESEAIYNFEKDRKKKKRDSNIIGRYFKKRNEQKKENARQEQAIKDAASRELEQRMSKSDYQTVQDAYDRFSRGDDSAYSSGAAGRQFDSSGAEVGYNDPFDPGGGEKDGGFIDGSNRRPFAHGGLASIL